MEVHEFFKPELGNVFFDDPLSSGTHEYRLVMLNRSSSVEWKRKDDMIRKDGNYSSQEVRHSSGA